MPQPQLQSIAAARQQIRDMLEGMVDANSPGFTRHSLDASLRLTHLERTDDGRSAKVVCTMQVTEGMSNHFMNMHGGCAASICDNLTSMVLYLHTSGVYGEPWSLLGVSQSIQMLYFAPCPVGSWIDIECQTLTVGKSVAVIQCDIYVKDGENGRRLRRANAGTHTKIDNSSQAKL
ncbi:hypothetical protein FA09DRAFT_328845 [Tilletiopsis washingtonensis]|uniref:Thioesterase domain-containing protein n=1 Tax=Tilletiopsis washingtonensis TaxID=58919 RepID=A0A316ZD53_9BASI|nr:hypothetical protein FA09DRAFT_328845 [Tilletiopsis washingtonensis]PWN99449.1 hypothetical protein FA09DRAFT_328845 [Tilletiopsis washingtonensis]